jgi:predicted 2-oxoglutarate/Fe(II)-dependent dioxygenase YbiX
MGHMGNKNTVEWLSEAIGEATRSAKFCASGCLPNVDPGIEVDGLGTLELPLKRTKKSALIESCQVAPYGKGTRTLVDKKVRNTYELDAKKIHLSDEWNAAIERAMRSVEVQLGLPAERLKAKLYKLLVYEKGGFFLSHRDSEKHDRMVASLIVALPNRFEGGTLIVRHSAAKQQLTFSEAAEGKSPCYAAFYSDCEHEVQRVTDGVRLCLAYNLVLEPQRAKSPSKAKAAIPSDPIADSDELCTLAIEKFCEPPSSESTHNSFHRQGELSLSEQSLPLLLRALVSSGRDEELSRVIRFVRETPDKVLTRIANS